MSDKRTFDKSSTDPLHWAAEIGRTLDDPLDEGWILGWFANYGVAVYDKQQAEIEHLKEYRKAIAHIGVDFGYGAFVIEQEMIEQARAEEQSE